MALTFLGAILFFGAPAPETVVREYGPVVYRHLKRLFGPRADVDDMFQSVFVEILRSLPTFRGKSHIKTWIHRITLNIAYQEMRRKYYTPALDELDDGAELEGDQTQATPAFHASPEQALAVRRLYIALAELDPKKRLAVVMHDVEGFKLREISDLLCIPLQTVASQLHAGRAELALAVEELRSVPFRRSQKEKEEEEVDSQ